MDDQKSLTAFQRAFFEWRDTVLLKKKSHKCRFLLACNTVILDSNGSVTPEMIQEGIVNIEAKNAQKFGARNTRKILGPVISVFKDYYGVIDTCCQADPFPSALVWGALKVIIEGLGRYFELFDKIRSQLLLLKFQLERLKWFEDLWGDSDDMQRYLCSTYIQVFRFWSAVDKECDRISLSALMRATASFSTKKIQAIIDDLSAEVDKVDKLGPIVEARIARGERQNSEEERLLAGLERMENRIERKEAAQFRDKVLVEQEINQQERIYSEISKWLGSRAANKPNFKRHHDNIDNRFENTCDWLLDMSWYKNWIKVDTDDPILWLYAQPGAGKSVLCSHAMAHVESLSDSPVVAFQFFHFDEQTTARQLVYNLAAQLFEQYWTRNKTIPENIRVHTTEAADDYKNIGELIHSLIPELPKVFIFLDGLDEEESMARQKEALKILDFVIELTGLFPQNVRFLLSSQDRAIFRNRLQTYTIVDVQSEIKIAVQHYLCQALPGLCDMSMDEGTQNWALKELQQRADGHFLWATLMIKEISQSIPSISHLKTFIKTGLPLDLHGYYARMLSRYRPGAEREYAVKILSLVVFAKRRLTVNEIIEAIWVTSDIEQKSDQMFVNFIKKLFYPLVVVESEDQDSNDDLCRLFHSTAKVFLINHPTVLNKSTVKENPRLLISEGIIASACLAYLRQSKYGTLLENHSVNGVEKWQTVCGEDIANHHLLLYSAKYWDKHLDNIEETPSLRSSVEGFLRSSNFVTTIQLQSLFVELHFGVYTLRGISNRYKWLKRVFPQWFSSRDMLKSGKPGARFVKFYRTFVSEWRYFLHCPTCSGLCRRLPYIGETDRCLWGTLGPQSFLSGNKSRYESFMLANDLAPAKRLSGKKSRICIDGFGQDGSEFALAHFASKRHPTTSDISIQIENWSLTSGSPPQLGGQCCISLDLEKCHWALYSEVTFDSRKMVPVKFSPDLGFLRIGSQILARQQPGEYTHFFGADSTNSELPWYFEEFAVQGKYLVLVSRQKPPKQRALPRRSSKLSKADITPPEDGDADSESEFPSTPSGSSVAKSKKSDKNAKATTPKSSPGTNDGKSESDGSEKSETHDIVSDSSVSLELDSDDEDWSDGSTDLEQIGFPASDDDVDNPSTEATEVSSDDESSGTAETDEVHPTGGPRGAHFEDSDSGRDVVFNDDDDDKVYRSDSDAPVTRRIIKSTTPKGTISVFDTSQSPPKLRFQYIQTLPVTLYDSPPVMHPTKPLVVWPTCGGSMLFVDFLTKSYFIRKSRTTSRHTRHVFMKAHFSSDGAYLHLASLEAQELPPPKNSKSKSSKTKGKNSSEPETKSKPRLQLSLFVTTHRLSQSKTTRSPPNLIHRTKLSLGSVTSISVAQMPLSLTWTPTHLYCTRSSNYFHVYRVGLFKANSSSSNLSTSITSSADIDGNIAVPKNEVLLPDSTRVREVHFFPPSEGVLGTILIGALNPISHRRIKEMTSEEDPKHKEVLPDGTSPPVGLYVNHGDLGEWISEEGREEELKGRSGRAGGFERKIERFDAEDDCDIEIYISR